MIKTVGSNHKRDKIERLTAFCKEHPDWWIHRYDSAYFLEKIKDDNERQELFEELRVLKKDYAYLVERYSCEALSEEEFNRLRESGVGGYFGFSQSLEQEVNKLITQYDKYMKLCNYSDAARERNITSFRVFLARCNAEYGSLDNFRQAYINALVAHNKAAFEQIVGGKVGLFISRFDASQGDFAARTGFQGLIKEIFGYSRYDIDTPHIYDWKYIESILESISTKYTTDVVRSRHGLNNEAGYVETFEDIAKSFEVGRERIRMINDNAMKILRRSENLEQICIANIDSDEEEQFIRLFFSHHDIFIFSDSDDLDEITKSRLTEIYESGASKRRAQKEENERRETAKIKAKEARRRASLKDKIVVSAMDGIEKLNLSNRAYNRLKRAGINTIGELMALSELEKIKQMGDKLVSEIEAVKSRIVIEDYRRRRM